MKMTNFSDNMNRLINGIDGKFGSKVRPFSAPSK
jgi:hypothetical protein